MATLLMDNGDFVDISSGGLQGYASVPILFVVMVSNLFSNPQQICRAFDDYTKLGGRHDNVPSIQLHKDITVE